MGPERRSTGEKRSFRAQRSRLMMSQVEEWGGGRQRRDMDIKAGLQISWCRWQGWGGQVLFLTSVVGKFWEDTGVVGNLFSVQGDLGSVQHCRLRSGRQTDWIQA